MEINDEVKAFFTKIIIPATVALSIKIAIMSREKKVTIFHVITSFVCGLGFAYLFYKPVLTSVPEDWIGLAIGAITLSGEKIGYYLIYKLKVEELIKTLLGQFVKK